MNTYIVALFTVDKILVAGYTVDNLLDEQMNTISYSYY
jgi:hypothetical protein